MWIEFHDFARFYHSDSLVKNIKMAKKPTHNNLTFNPFSNSEMRNDNQKEAKVRNKNTTKNWNQDEPI